MGEIYISPTKLPHAGDLVAPGTTKNTMDNQPGMKQGQLSQLTGGSRHIFGHPGRNTVRVATPKKYFLKSWKPGNYVEHIIYVIYTLW